VEVFHLARFARAFFFARRFAPSIHPSIRPAAKTKKGEPVDGFAFVCVLRLVPAVTPEVMWLSHTMHARGVTGRASARQAIPYFNASRAALTAASTCSGAVPPG
jgi:hypothetical protein